MVEVVEKVEKVYCYPFFGIDVFGDGRNGFEGSFDEGGVDEWCTEVEGFTVAAEGNGGCGGAWVGGGVEVGVQRGGVEGGHVWVGG